LSAEGHAMTKHEIEAVLARVRTWPVDRQEDAARILLQMEEMDSEPAELTEEDRAALDEAEAEIERGEVASNREVDAVLSRYRL
jgi:hypothetical protein